MKKISNNTIKENFRNYLMTHCGLKHTSTYTYISALNGVSNLLNFNGVIENTIYDLRNVHEVLYAKEFAKTLYEYELLNKERRSLCGVALSHYCDFVATDSNFDHKWNMKINIPNK